MRFTVLGENNAGAVKTLPDMKGPPENNGDTLETMGGGLDLGDPAALRGLAQKLCPHSRILHFFVG